MGSCAAPSAKGDDKFITTDYLQQCPSYSYRYKSYNGMFVFYQMAMRKDERGYQHYLSIVPD
ncbi:hypothetical protein MJ634_020775 [Providencia rettgeri]|uniref:hypothetical protein n=1 Tax=Providencia rettgeri TaxID=587 RepID=UPI001B35EC45|nr:hypothetical protein [Providencia rettgeri]EJD6049365.1 hypothetical protein [Providencia rettgeri]EJD6049833.1 hypothetical protein [Providencia rettgeri]MBQ0606830.1 hypothetical protein [Providencia rettgeri]MCB4814617.1 hypothetical protein [Providencia rettgeri]MCJ2225457.1 hypothetical protein [Providencia rettgeri]